MRAGQDGLTYLVSPRGQIVNQLEPYSPGVLRLESLPAPRWALRGGSVIGFLGGVLPYFGVVSGATKAS